MVKLEVVFKVKGYDVVIVNVVVFGDMMGDGFVCVDWLILDGIDGVIFEFGVNDVLCGFVFEDMKKNLDVILVCLKECKILVLLVGM